MKKDLKNPEVALRVKSIYTSQGKDRQWVADLLNISVRKVYNIEKGDDEYTERDLELLRKALGIEGMPLKDEEVVPCEKRLLRLSETLAFGRFNEAKVYIEELSPILKIECCLPHLSWLYRLLRVDFLMSQGDIEEARKEMKFFEEKVNDMTVRHRYHYLHNKGRLYFRDFKHVEAAKLFEKSAKITEDNEGFLPIHRLRPIFNIGLCYTDSYHTTAAIAFLEDVKGKNSNSGIDFFDFKIDIALATNYTRSRVFKIARFLLNKSLDYAEGTNNEFHIGLVHYNFGHEYMHAKRCDEAIESQRKAQNYFETGSVYHSWSSFYEAYCTIEKGDYKTAKKILEESKYIYIDKDGNGINNMLIPYNHLIAFHNVHKGPSRPKDEDIDYMLNVSIPYFLSRHYKYLAIRAYELIIENYERRGQIAKAAHI